VITSKLLDNLEMIETCQTATHEAISYKQNIYLKHFVCIFSPEYYTVSYFGGHKIAYPEFEPSLLSMELELLNKNKIYLIYIYK